MRLVAPVGATDIGARGAGTGAVIALDLLLRRPELVTAPC